jgi:hypothetical protein
LGRKAQVGSTPTFGTNLAARGRADNCQNGNMQEGFADETP